MIEIKKDKNNFTNILKTNNKNTKFECITIENRKKIIMNVIYNSNIIKKFSLKFKCRV